MQSYNLTHLKELESEAIFIIREVAAQFERPVMLFSGGKDSIIMFHLARKLFTLAKFRFHLCMLTRVITFQKLSASEIN